MSISKPSQFCIKTVPILSHGSLKLNFRLHIEEKIIQQRQTVLGGVAPEDGTQGRHRLFPLSIVSSPADVPNVRLELFDDLVYVVQLLRG